jgi:hypothetical protein
LQTLGVALEPFALDHQGQPVLEVQSSAVGLAVHLFQRTGHADKAQFAQAVGGGMSEQGRPPQW